MAFERVCSLDEVRADQGLAVTVGRYEIVVARNAAAVLVT